MTDDLKQDLVSHVQRAVIRELNNTTISGGNGRVEVTTITSLILQVRVPTSSGPRYFNVTIIEKQ